MFGMLAGVLASMIESVGDYYAAARYVTTIVILLLLYAYGYNFISNTYFSMREN